MAMTKQKLVVLAVRGSLSADSEWAFSSGHWSWHDEVPLSVWMEKGRIVRLQENWVWALMCRLISCFQARQVSGAPEWCEISVEQQIEERDLWHNYELLIALAVIGPIKQLNACFVDGWKGSMSALCYMRLYLLRSLRGHALLRWQCTTTRL